MSDKIFQDLNEKQIEAVKIIDGPVLVISGPGSGKTRCLTNRVAYLISQDIPPEHILAVTFTNKAAGEMRERIINLLNSMTNKPASQTRHLPLISTFHSIGLRILREDIHELNYKTSFSVYDEDDQLSLVKKILKELELDPKSFNPKIILYKISELKTKLIFPEDYETKNFYSDMLGKVYKRYQENLRELSAVDFDDLIVLPVMIFQKNPETLSKHQERWHYILVDEYQDTSYDQYILINLLAKKRKNIFCIGDDAQSIYQFRRADIRNILNFQKDYPEAKIVLLEQNYRSTKNIILAAQEIISKNKSQIPKELWTDNDAGEKIIIAEAMNERHEAGMVISRIEELIEKEGMRPGDFTVLYRTHAQSRAMEEALIMASYPYQIVGGLKFYDRKEIKDILSYLRLIANTADTIALERIHSIPPRGIGKSIIDNLVTNNGPDILVALAELLKNGSDGKRKMHALSEFYKLLNDLINFSREKRLKEIIKYIIKKIDYETYLKDFSLDKHGDYESYEDRIENLKELQTVASKYDTLPGLEGIRKFLEEITLLQQNDRTRNSKNKSALESVSDGRITLMTTHASKGLEFQAVFVIGMEEGLFPHSRAIINPNELEEERRLCYVAITRAKEKLMLTYAKYRNIYGSGSASLPSRFITEIPGHVIDWRLTDNSYYEDDEKIFY